MAQRIACIVLASLLIGATPARPGGTIQSYHSFKSWFVACDNTLRCVARGFGETDEAKAEITRDAGPSGKIEMVLQAERLFEPAEVRLDGKPAVLAAGDWHEQSDDDGTLLTTDKLATIRALVARLRNGTTLSLGESKVPLDGFSAAMLRMDERQGRIGGVTALIRPGPTAAALVPPAPALPRIPLHRITTTLGKGEAARLIAAVRAQQHNVFEKEEYKAEPTAMEPEAFALNDRQALVLITCLMGAYQDSSLGFIAERKTGQSKLLRLPTPYLGGDPDENDDPWLTEGDFEPKTGTLTMAHKGRGLADCGQSASWIWDGAVFRLASLNYQEACGGYGAGDWPPLYRSLQ